MRRFLADHWFALALVALCVIGLPSLFLFGMSLFGYEGAANRWPANRSLAGRARGAGRCFPSPRTLRRSRRAGEPAFFELRRSSR